MTLTSLQLGKLPFFPLEPTLQTTRACRCVLCKVPLANVWFPVSEHRPEISDLVKERWTFSQIGLFSDLLPVLLLLKNYRLQYKELIPLLKDSWTKASKTRSQKDLGKHKCFLRIWFLIYPATWNVRMRVVMWPKLQELTKCERRQTSGVGSEW